MTWPLFFALVGFIAYITNVAGNLLLAWKSAWGWVVRAISITLWGVYAWDIDSWPMIFNAITFFGINCYGYRKWTKDNAQMD